MCTYEPILYMGCGHTKNEFIKSCQGKRHGFACSDSNYLRARRSTGKCNNPCR